MAKTCWTVQLAIGLITQPQRIEQAVRQLLAGELTGTAAADVRVHLQGLVAVTHFTVALGVGAHGLLGMFGYLVVAGKFERMVIRQDTRVK